MRRNTTVVHAYVVDIMNKLDDTEVTDEVLIEAEDDIVSAAVFIYQMDASFGDELQFPVRVGWCAGDNAFVVVSAKDDLSYLDQLGDKYYGIVVCTVRATEGRL